MDEAPELRLAHRRDERPQPGDLYRRQRHLRRHAIRSAEPGKHAAAVLEHDASEVLMVRTTCAALVVLLFAQVAAQQPPPAPAGPTFRATTRLIVQTVTV